MRAQEIYRINYDVGGFLFKFSRQSEGGVRVASGLVPKEPQLRHARINENCCQYRIIWRYWKWCYPRKGERGELRPWLRYLYSALV